MDHGNNDSPTVDTSQEDFVNKLVIAGLPERVSDEQVAHLRRILITRLGAVIGLVFAADSFKVEVRRDTDHVDSVVCSAENFLGLDLQVNNLVRAVLSDSVAMWMDAISCGFEAVEVKIGDCSQILANPRFASPDKHALIIRRMAGRVGLYASEEDWAQASNPAAAAVWHELVAALVRQMGEVLALHDELARTPA
jgi:hypothetical protein